eukprot:m.918118 g.918118  ORF g.918118 m.918118 type:complete len:114 (+) comp60173_c0_seq1:2235-2576(+)
MCGSWVTFILPAAVLGFVSVYVCDFRDTVGPLIVAFDFDLTREIVQMELKEPISIASFTLEPFSLAVDSTGSGSSFGGARWATNTSLSGVLVSSDLLCVQDRLERCRPDQPQE